MSRDKTLIEMREILGPEATRDMQRHFGGERLYIPAQASLFSRLTTVLGVDLSVKLSFHYGGTQLSVPFDPVIDRERRNLGIVQDRAQGNTLNELVRKYRLSHRQVQQILRRAREETLSK